MTIIETIDTSLSDSSNLSRQQVGDGRFYGTPDGLFPSVTTIISATEKPEAKARLAQWKANNPGHEFYARRGTQIHDVCRRYLLGLREGIDWGNSDFPMACLLDSNSNPLSPAEAEFCLSSLAAIKDFVSPLRDSLERFDPNSLVWVEGPVQNQHSFTIGSDNNPRLWSREYKFAGCPDLIGSYMSNELILVDIKSSDDPYRKFKPSASWGTDEARKEFKAWMKLRKAAMQIAAYIIAAKETLELDIKKGMILLATPGGSFTYTFDEKQLGFYTKLWLDKVEKYYADQANAEGDAKGNTESNAESGTSSDADINTEGNLEALK